MTKPIKRRDFMRTSAAAGLTLAGAKASVLQFPNVLVQSGVKPIVISSANGNRFKNGGDVTAVQKAFTMMTGGADVLDAVIAGVNIVELDPLDDSVGYGGLPNADGVVQLDSSCMHGPKKRAGAVAASRGSAHAVARGEGRLREHRSPLAGRQGRAGFRAQHGLQDRRRPEHGTLATTLAGMETPHGPFTLSRSKDERRSLASRDDEDGCGRFD